MRLEDLIRWNPSRFHDCGMQECRAYGHYVRFSDVEKLVAELTKAPVTIGGIPIKVDPSLPDGMAFMIQDGKVVAVFKEEEPDLSHLPDRTGT